MPSLCREKETTTTQQINCLLLLLYLFSLQVEWPVWGYRSSRPAPFGIVCKFNGASCISIFPPFNRHANLHLWLAIDDGFAFRWPSDWWFWFGNLFAFSLSRKLFKLDAARGWAFAVSRRPQGGSRNISLGSDFHSWENQFIGESSICFIEYWQSELDLIKQPRRGLKQEWTSY